MIRTIFESARHLLSGRTQRALIAYGCGAAALGALLLATHRWPEAGSTPQPSAPFAYGWVVLVAFVPYGLVAWSWIRDRGPSRRCFWIVAACIGMLFVIAPPVQSHDVYEYVAYGRMEALHGTNPYLEPPGELPNDPITPLLGWPNARSVYGPAWVAPTSLMVAILPGSIRVETIAIKAMSWLLVLLAGWAIERSALGGEAAAERGRLAAFLFVCNPLVITSEALGGHADAAIAAGFALAVLADRRGRKVLAVVALSLTALVKIWAVLPLAIYLVARVRRASAREEMALLAVPLGIAVATYAPFWAGTATLSPASDAVGRTSSSFAGAIQVLLDLTFRAADWARPQLAAIDTTRLLSAAALLVLLAWLAHRVRAASDPWTAAAIIVGASFLATPWYLPWYSVGPLALGLCVGGGAAIGSLMLSTTSCAAIPLLAGGAMLRFVSPAFGWGLGDRRARRAARINSPS